MFLQTIVGTDIADLLLEGHEPSSAEYAKFGASIRQAPSSLDTTGSAPPESDVSTVVTQDRSLINKATDISAHDLTDRFRQLLLHGRKKVGV